MTVLDLEEATGDQLLEKARRIAGVAHAGQFDKVGHPYVSHCERVASRVTGRQAKIVAYLHDILEKGEGWSAPDLRDEGFPDVIVVAVEALSRQPAQNDRQFLSRTAANPLAAVVKVADLQDNIAQARSAGLGARKYTEALRVFRELAGAR